MSDDGLRYKEHPLSAVHRVAYAIARVIAKKTMAEDPILARMDGLGKASAVHTMAVRMTNELLEEAAEAYAEAVKIRHEDEAQLKAEAAAGADVARSNGHV